MSIDKTVYLGLAINTNGVDLSVGKNEDESLFYRPFCEDSGKYSKYWIPNAISSEIAPNGCGEECPLIEMSNDSDQALTHVSDVFKKRLSISAREFLKDLKIDYKLVIVYFLFYR